MAALTGLASPANKKGTGPLDRLPLSFKVVARAECEPSPCEPNALTHPQDSYTSDRPVS
jgi:hypothetical protein